MLPAPRSEKQVVGYAVENVFNKRLSWKHCSKHLQEKKLFLIWV